MANSVIDPLSQRYRFVGSSLAVVVYIFARAGRCYNSDGIWANERARISALNILA